MVSLSDRVILDGVDVTHLVTNWRVDRIGRDVPTVILELVPHMTDVEGVVFEGLANVRIGVEEPGLLSFLNSIDIDQLEKMVLTEGDMSVSPIAGALEILKRLAINATP